MSTSHTQRRPFLTPSQGPAGEDMAPLDKIRDAIAERVPALDALSPEAVDLTAEVLATLHTHLHGRASTLHGHRPPKTRRQQLRGEDPLQLEDLAFLLLEAPRATVLALDVLARRAGYRVVPADLPAPTSSEAQARLAEANGELQAACARANATYYPECRTAWARWSGKRAALWMEYARRGGRGLDSERWGVHAARHAARAAFSACPALRGDA